MKIPLTIGELKLMVNLIEQYHEYDSGHTSDSLLIKLKQALTNQVALRNTAISSYNSEIKRGVE
ncbi:hypothetical protein JEP32_00245 [Proteus mirabilis]|nr:hypothetical protein [Proteus mirabilis]MBI6347375.1 hypothetical protein [Proteus mirabilis]